MSESGGTVYLPGGVQYIGEWRYGGPSSHSCFLFITSRVTGNQIFHNLVKNKRSIIFFTFSTKKEKHQQYFAFFREKVAY